MGCSVSDEEWVKTWYDLGGLELAYDTLRRHIDNYQVVRRLSMARPWSPADEKVQDYRQRTGRRLGELHKLKSRLEHARTRQPALS